jgi:hypothetical protein
MSETQGVLGLHTFLDEKTLRDLRESNAVVALIDADIPAYSVSFTCEKEASWNHVERTHDAFMRKQILACEASHYIGFLTNGGLNYRLEVAKTRPYKGNRAGAERPKWFPKSREYLQNGWKCQVMQGIEADDALTIAQAYFRSHGIKSVICSLDKDLLQEPGWHWNWNSGILQEVSYERAQRYLWEQVITGDLGTDNIPGISDSADLWTPVLGDKYPVHETYLKIPKEPKITASGKPSTRKMAHTKFSHYEYYTDSKQIKASADFLYGKTRAKEMLAGLHHTEYPAVVLEEYISAYWEQGELEGYEDPAQKGIERMEECFALVYMLRTVEEIPNDATIDFTPHPVGSIEFNEFEEDEDDDSLADFNDDY